MLLFLLMSNYYCCKCVVDFISTFNSPFLSLKNVDIGKHNSHLFQNKSFFLQLRKTTTLIAYKEFSSFSKNNLNYLFRWLPDLNFCRHSVSYVIIVRLFLTTCQHALSRTDRIYLFILLKSNKCIIHYMDGSKIWTQKRLQFCFLWNRV